MNSLTEHAGCTYLDLFISCLCSFLRVHFITLCTFPQEGPAVMRSSGVLERMKRLYV